MSGHYLSRHSSVFMARQINSHQAYMCQHSQKSKNDSHSEMNSLLLKLHNVAASNPMPISCGKMPKHTHTHTHSPIFKYYEIIQTNRNNKPVHISRIYIPNSVTKQDVQYVTVQFIYKVQLTFYVMLPVWLLGHWVSQSFSSTSTDVVKCGQSHAPGEVYSEAMDCLDWKIDPFSLQNLKSLIVNIQQIALLNDTVCTLFQSKWRRNIFCITLLLN